MLEGFTVNYDCSACKGQLLIEKLVVDIRKCRYVILCECVVCGEKSVVSLELMDFIDISRELGNQKPPMKLGEGGDND